MQTTQFIVPRELLPLIFSSVVGSDRVSLRLTCKYFRTICPPQLIKGSITNEKELRTLIDAMLGMQVWKGHSDCPEVFLAIFPKYFSELIPLLNALEVKKITLVALFGRKFPKMFSFDLENAKYIKELKLADFAFMKYPPNLEKLDVSGGFLKTPTYFVHSWFPANILENKHIEFFPSSLKELDLSFNDGIGLRVFFDRFTKLEILNLSNCRGMNDAIFPESLKSLNISNTMFAERRLVNLPIGLTQLDISICRNIFNTTWLSRLSNLQCLICDSDRYKMMKQEEIPSKCKVVFT